MRLRIIPQEVKFFELFEKDADNVLHGAKLLKDLVDDYRDVEEKVRLITEREHEGDFITHTIVEQLNKTFVTPFDREDMHILTSALDDVMDRMESAAEVMLIFNIPEPTNEVRALVNVIVKSAEEIALAIPLLRNRQDMRKILERCIEINRLENEADRLQRRALMALFHSPVDALDAIKWKEVYEQLEMATDRCEDVADVLQAMVMKHA